MKKVASFEKGTNTKIVPHDDAVKGITNIDTLEVAFDFYNYDMKISKLQKELELCKSRARQSLYDNDSKKEHIIINNIRFEVLPNGARSYAYILHNDLIELKMAQGRSGNEDTLPIKVKFKSTLLWSKGLNGYFYAEELLIAVFGKIKCTKVSRVDMAFHTDIFNSDILYIDDFVGQFKKDTMHRADRKIETLYFGSRKTQKVLCRIYNKTREVLETKSKNWFFDIWDKHGLNITNIWNVEFEIHRDFLREIKVDTYTDLLDKLQDIWHYLTHKWIRYIDINSATRRENCKMRNQWKIVQDGFRYIEKNGYINRDVQRLREIGKMVPGVVGYLTALSALAGINDVDEAIWFLKGEMDWYLQNKKRSTFKDIVEDKKKTFTTENHLAMIMKGVYDNEA